MNNILLITGNYRWIIFVDEMILYQLYCKRRFSCRIKHINDRRRREKKRINKMENADDLTWRNKLINRIKLQWNTRKCFAYLQVAIWWMIFVRIIMNIKIQFETPPKPMVVGMINKFFFFFLIIINNSPTPPAPTTTNLYSIFSVFFFIFHSIISDSNLIFVFLIISCSLDCDTASSIDVQWTKYVDVYDEHTNTQYNSTILLIYLFISLFGSFVCGFFFFVNNGKNACIKWLRGQ